MKISKLIGLMLLMANFAIAQNTSYSTNDNNVLGDKNTMIGAQTGTSATIGVQNTAIGHEAFKNGTGDGNVNIGWRSGWNITGGENTFIGKKAGYNAQSGDKNVAIGIESLLKNNGGDNNLAIGSAAGYRNTTGQSNVFMGSYAGKNNKTGGYNIYLGVAAGQGRGGTKNVAIGSYAGQSSLVQEEVVVEGQVVQEEVPESGDFNVFLGYKAGEGLADVSNKLYIQSSAAADITNPLIYGDFATKQLGIGTSHVPTDPETNIPFTLAVNGKTITEEVQVMMRDTWWPDYVFAEDYDLMSLTDLETEIEALGHLPGVPSAEEVETNGHALGRMDAILLEKIEELTLHLIDMNKEIKDLREENTALKDDIKALKK